MDKNFNDLLQGPDYTTTVPGETSRRTIPAMHEILVLSGVAGSITKEKILRFIKGKSEVPSIYPETSWLDAIPEDMKEPEGRLEEVMSLVEAERMPFEKAWDNALLIDIKGPNHQRRLALREPLPRFSRTKETFQKVKAAAAHAGSLAMRGASSKSW